MLTVRLPLVGAAAVPVGAGAVPVGAAAVLVGASLVVSGLIWPGVAGAWTHRGAKWERSVMPVQYEINRDLARNLSDQAVVAAIRAGYDAWAEPECAWAESRYMGRTDNFQFGRDDGKNVVSWRFRSWSESSDAIAVTSTITGFSQNIRDSDMVFNDINFDFATQVTPGRMDVAAIATHEAGHFFGMGHAQEREDRDATMWPSTGPSNISPRTLHEDDIEGICDLYAVEFAPGVEMGEPCGEGCEGGLVCLNDDTAGGVAYCTRECEFRDDCPAGYFCVSGEREDDKLCRRYPEGEEPGADLGDACSSEGTGSACQIGLFCTQDGQVEYCTGRCQDETNVLVAAACPPDYCCEARRGGIFACLLIQPGDQCEGADFRAEQEKEELPEEGDEEGDGEAGAGEEAAGEDGPVDNSLCTSAPVGAGTEGGAWRLFARR